MKHLSAIIAALIVAPITWFACINHHGFAANQELTKNLIPLDFNKFAITPIEIERGLHIAYEFPTDIVPMTSDYSESSGGGGGKSITINPKKDYKHLGPCRIYRESNGVFIVSEFHAIELLNDLGYTVEKQ